MIKANFPAVNNLFYFRFARLFATLKLFCFHRNQALSCGLFKSKCRSSYFWRTFKLASNLVKGKWGFIFSVLNASTRKPEHFRKQRMSHWHKVLLVNVDVFCYFQVTAVASWLISWWEQNCSLFLVWSLMPQIKCNKAKDIEWFLEFPTTFAFDANVLLNKS